MSGLTLQAALIWALGPIFQVFCVYLLYRRKLLSQFSFFASYLILVTILNAVRFFCYREFGISSWWYFSAYWVGTALTDMMAIAVVYEIFCAAFKPFAGLQDLARVVFKWAAALIFFIGLLVFFGTTTSTAGGPYHWVTTSVQDFELIVRVIQCGLLMFLFIGSQHLGVSLRNQVFGFALGFGLNAFLQLLVFSAARISHVSKMPIWLQLPPMVYFASLLIWAVYLVKPEPEPESIHIPITSPLLRWNEVALALGHSGGQVRLMSQEPFMPQVERMVEHVMQKEIVERRQSRTA